MKYLSALFLLAVITFPVEAQLSYGGKPLTFSENRLRSFAPDNFYVEMPAFDATQMMREDSINELAGLRRKRFAKKFRVNITPENSGIRFVSDDGMNIWRVGIRSKGAYSLNILFSTYHIPEGAKVFLYNADQSQILGAFTEKNNSEDNMLPTSPVSGDELIIEYQEPENAAFPGMLAIREVNHAYALTPTRPGSPEDSSCQQDPVCRDDVDNETQSVCLLTIDGMYYCTGSLINNAEQDGTPYLLTACHCLDFGEPVEEIAKTVVAFFNYQSPSCNTRIRGSEEMSMTSASLKASDKNLDMALLLLPEIPPPDFRPYYLGWNISTNPHEPYVCIHQPNGGIKKVAQSDGKINISLNLQIENTIYRELWWIKKWNAGITEPGSSGSPLLNNEKQIIGALTGGSSDCKSPEDDWFWTLKKAWEYHTESNRQLKYWLDPQNTGITNLNGFNPYRSDSCLKISNLARNEAHANYALETPESGYMFGYNSLGTDEYAEKFELAKPCLLYGVSLVTPVLNGPRDNKKITVNVYADGELVKEAEFRPKYESFNSPNIFFETDKQFNYNEESYLRFTEPIQIKNEFYISYRLDYSVASAFHVYCAASRTSDINTAYYRENDAWIPVSDHVNNPINTSLWINPVIKYNSGTNIQQIADTKNEILIYKDKNDAIHVKSNVFLENARINIWSISGAHVYSTRFSGSEHLFYSDNLAKGMYVLTLQNQSGEILSREKIISR